ncbi:MAG: bifunctional diaminohydroxyphosphoribosylaminopyrimidine deaminase/5-amino-6-(5-phosphoribosylamino)uracil reductase RibD [Marinilabiliaceae bacterium]
MYSKSQDRIYMQRCIDLARKAEGHTFPNPMVGCVIVHNGRIIGEGFHQKAGEPHAEVNAIRSVRDETLLQHSTLYVNLEPCSHYGKTPPCSLLIQEKSIPRVVIGCRDSFSEVAGRGIDMLRQAGVEVTEGVLEEESRELNRRFFTFHEKKRPYVILKWAETRDGFLDIDRASIEEARPTWITDDWARRMVHKWRSTEPSILVGTVTALKDNPSLTVRDWSGAHPLRMVIDRFGKLPSTLTLFNGKIPTLVFAEKGTTPHEKAETIYIEFGDNPLKAIYHELYQRNIQSVMVEGGGILLQSFTDSGLWDEARVFVGEKWFVSGVKAPVIRQKPHAWEQFGNSRLFIYRNNSLS